MDKKILLEAEINYDDGVERFSGYSNVYEKYLKKFINEIEFNNFFEAMDKKDYEVAFRSAHSLKGILGNLSIDGLFKMMDVMTELLRNEKDIPSAINHVPTIHEKYDAVIAVLKSQFPD